LIVIRAFTGARDEMIAATGGVQYDIGVVRD
jgi:hypothetical protein